MTTQRNSHWGLCLLAMILAAGTAGGQQTAPGDDRDISPPPTADQVQQQITALEAIEDPSEEDQTRLQLYRSALESLKAAAESRKLKAQYVDKEGQAPVELQELRAELDEPPKDLEPESPPGATLAVLEKELKSAQINLSTARARIDEIDAGLAGRESRADELREQIALAQHELERLARQEAALPLAGESPALTAARRVRIQTDRQATRDKVVLLQQEQSNDEARRELLPLRRERWVRYVAQLEKLAGKLQKAVDAARQADIRRKQEEAARAAAKADPVVAPIAQATLDLARRRDELQPLIEQAGAELSAATPAPGELSRKLDGLRQKVEVVGLTSTVGLLLRKSAADLPDVAALRKAIKQRQATMSALEFERLELSDEKDALVADQEKTVRHYEQQIDPGESKLKREAIEREIREQLHLQREYFSSLIVDLTTYFDRLQALNERDQQVIDLTNELTGFIEQHILWIRSAKPIGIDDFRHAGAAAAWMFSPRGWNEVLRGVWDYTKSRWPLALMATAGLIGLLVVRQLLRRRIVFIGRDLATPVQGTVGQFLRVTLLTLLCATTWPILIWTAGTWVLLANPDGRNDLAVAVGEALRVYGVFLFPLFLGYEACEPRGLGELHFGWQARTVRVARRQVGLVILIISVLGLPVSVVNHQGNLIYENSLGRLCFVVAVLGLAYCVHGLLNPRGGIVRDYLAARPGSWANRLRYVWYPIALLTPTVLAVASLMGYHYTALRICREVLHSAGFLVIVVLVYYLVLRWITFGQHQLTLRQARERQEAEQERAAHGQEDSGRRPSLVEAAQLDISAISGKARQLLRGAVLFALLIGFAAIWSDSMPAIGFLERVELWQGAAVVAAEGGATAEPTYGMVTLQDLLLAIVVVIITIIVARNIPALLGITVLQHLPLDRGSQFAIATIVRYTITIVGVAVALRVIGVTWVKVQWLAAALTVGLGFGLNEIFGNFIAGLIILFERPIRVGDTVTVGTITGTVSRIQIRSTTLVDWDRKELVIPNKTFITETIVNWTLTDTLLRLVFPIRLEHGADTELAGSLMLKVAAGHPNVLADPKPSLMFKQVDDKGLEIDLRLFIPDIDYFVRVRHEVYNGIIAEFRKAGIRFFEGSHRDVALRTITGEVPVEIPH